MSQKCGACQSPSTNAQFDTYCCNECGAVTSTKDRSVVRPPRYVNQEDVAERVGVDPVVHNESVKVPEAGGRGVKVDGDQFTTSESLSTT